MWAGAARLGSRRLGCGAPKCSRHEDGTVCSGQCFSRNSTEPTIASAAAARDARAAMATSRSALTGMVPAGELRMVLAG